MKFLPIVFRVLLALPMIIFGANKFFNFMAMPELAEGSAALVYMTAFGSTYLAKLVGLTEVVGGLMLLPKKTAALGAIVLMPVLVNILAYNATVDPTGAGIGISLFCLALGLGVLFFNKERVLPLIGDSGAA